MLKVGQEQRQERGRIVSYFGKFAVTGAIGFAVDAALLSLLVETTEIGPYLSRAISFPVALSATWFLNRTWTFKRSDQDRLLQSVRYVVVQSFGALVNLSIYALSIAAGPLVVERLPIIALALASAAAMVVNFLGSRYWVFAGPHKRA